MGTIWVQSKYSKDARKFEVFDQGERSPYYCYWLPPDQGFVLPKAEYTPCDPPERWDICMRGRVSLDENGDRLYADGNFIAVRVAAGYRWAWSEKDPDALVIERKVP